MKRILPLIFLIIAGCKPVEISTGMIQETAPLIVYKTTGDFYNNVPISMNGAKDRIMSFPAPSDLRYEGELSYPVRLRGYYLLDRTGIGPNTVFTSYTYEEYSSFQSPPTMEELMDHIIEYEPFEAMYDCGNRGKNKDLVKELNRKIEDDFKECKKLK